MDRGIFEAARQATGVPDFDVSSPWQLLDLNGDGWVDLVHVGVDQVDFALATSAWHFWRIGQHQRHTELSFRRLRLNLPT